MVAACLWQTIFWFCLICIVYSYLGYPLLIWAAARRQPRVSGPCGGKQTTPPRVTLLIAAHNEERIIGQRLRNALSTKYPHDRLEILVISDGSSDATAAIVRSHADRGVKLLELSERRGKLHAIIQGARIAGGDVLVLSDASTRFHPQAIKQLTRHFRRPSVGVVSGRLILQDPATGTNVDGLYWRYESFIKRTEAKLGAMLGASGAIYAIRKSCFIAPPPHLVIDDFVIPLLARLQHQCTAVLERQAIAWQSTPASLQAEFRRRARIGAGGFQSIRLLWKLLHPRYGWMAVAFLSHKVLRWLCPFFLVGVLLASAGLLEQPFYRAAWYSQCAFYSLAAAGLFLKGQWRAFKWIRLTTMFGMMNVALMLGFWRWLLGTQKGVWQRTVREAL